MITLVTGATGLLGNNVVRLLLDRGEAVRVLVREGGDPRPLEGLDVEVCHGDVRDPHAMRWAADGAETVIHSAARVHIGRSGMSEQQATNIEGTRNAAQAALQAGARFIYVSTVDTLGSGSAEQPADETTVPYELRISCPYVQTKREAEQLVLQMAERGLDAVVVNPAYMLGPWDWKPSSGRMLLSVSKGWALAAPRGGNNFCDARDVAAGILAAAERGRTGRRYILGGTSLTYREAWSIFAEVTGVRPPLFTARGGFALRLAGKVGDLSWRLSGHEPDINSAAVELAEMPRFFSSERAASELGYHSRDIRQSAQDTWSWFRAHGYAA